MRCAGLMHKTICNLINLILFAAFISCKNDQAESHVNSIDSTIVPVNTTMRKLSREFKTLHGEYVIVKGKFYYEFENVALYDHDVFPNLDMRFWLAFNSGIDEKILERLSGETVTIKGKVDTSDKGHLGGYLASITDIYYIKQD